jgi:hypothetical protein
MMHLFWFLALGLPTLTEDRAAEVDRAVERGLDFLVQEQLGTGCWSGGVGHKQQDGYLLFDSSARQERDGDGHPGVTALAGLAFLADGHLPDRGPGAQVLPSVIDYFLRNQNEFGFLSDSGTRMYSHSFATLFLAQVHGMTAYRADEIRQALQQAANFIQDTQNQFGAWRYSPFTVEADLSVTVCQAQALRSASNAGIHVRPDCIDRVLDYVRRSRISSGDWEGAFYYKIYGRAAHTKTSYTINAAAIASLQSAGVYRPDEYGAAIDFLEHNYDWVSRRYPDHYFFWYGNYYAAQVLHMEGGERWHRFWCRMRDDLLARQQDDGCWHNDVGPGHRFSTAVACLLLRIPAQYLPIFQK